MFGQKYIRIAKREELDKTGKRSQKNFKAKEYRYRDKQRNDFCGG